MLAAHPQVYDKVRMTVLAKGKMQIAPDGTRRYGRDLPQHPQLGLGRHGEGRAWRPPFAP